MTSASSPEPNQALPVVSGPRPAAEHHAGVIDSDHLFAGRTEIRLRHRGQEYRLRITRQGKLILTK